jgi:single-strand DNA-binding protein
MNTITIAGRLTKNAESKQAGGETVVSFGLAEDVFVNKEKTAQFYDCDFWGKRAAGVAQYLEKGSPVTVTGSLTKHEHNGKTYLKVRVNDVALQGGKRDNATSGNYGTSGNGASAKHTAPVDDDQIPF